MGVCGAGVSHSRALITLITFADGSVENTGYWAFTQLL